LTVGEIHARTGVAHRAIRATIAERASDADRAARQRACRRARRPATFSDRELLGGLRAVAHRLGKSPSLRQYDRLAAGLGLACGQTVYMRFGGWRKGLEAAGLDAAAPRRMYASRWHIAACWRALESVADELGDPPQVEVAALRHLARHPGSSGTEVKNGAGIRSGSQVWTLLARLEREGLLVNERSGSESAWKNAWRLSGRGRDVLSGLPEGMYA
jgi:hypothetical protein